MRNDGWIEIARTGTWTPLSGVPVTLTTDHFDRLVAGFDPADPETAPLVFGHPKVEDPAFGAAEALRRDDDRLLARFRDVPEAVKNLVRAGHYRAVSPKFNADLSRLIHVGLLGAVPPAIKGLKPVAFSAAAAADAGVTLEFAQEGDSVDELKKAQSRIREIEAENAKLKARVNLEFAQGGNMDELERAKARISELEAENAKLKTRIAELEGQGKTAQDKVKETEKAFADYKAAEAGRGREKRFADLLKSGRTLPGEKAKVMAFAEALAASEGDLEFADGTGQTATVTKEEAYWRDLEARPENGLFQEFAAPSGSGKAGGVVPADLTKHV